MPTSEQPASTFGPFLGRHILDRRRDIARRWGEALTGPRAYDGDRGARVAGELDLPRILEHVAAFVADPEANSLDEGEVAEALGRFAEARMSDGARVQELVRDFHVLADVLSDTVDDAMAGFEGSSPVADVVTTVARLMASINVVSAVTTRSFCDWTDRFEREWKQLLETYGQVMSHEVGNRLGAAETAIQLLQTSIPLDDARRARLYQIIRSSIRGGLQTIADLEVLVRPSAVDGGARGISLWLLVKESVRLAGSRAEGTGIAISIETEVPDVRVPGPPVRIALANLLSNAVKYHREDGEDRWIRIETWLGEGDDTVRLSVEDNGPGIPDEAVDRVFEYRFRGHTGPVGSGLGLAITRHILERAGGSVSLERGSEGGARFTVTVPRSQDDGAEPGPESPFEQGD